MKLVYDIISFDDGTYGILEENTGHVIQKYMKLFDAEKLIHALRKGSGFQGHTPTFLTYGEYYEKT